MEDNTIKGREGQVSERNSTVLSGLCYQYVKPLLKKMNEGLDRRLVKTFIDLMLVMVILRNRHQGLLLSELGGQLMGGGRATAGTKRIHNLIASPGWKAQDVEKYLWEKADEGVNERLNPRDEVYVIWDESVIEKAESLKAERLCAVRSSKARRLSRIKPGYYNPPTGRPVFVPGMN